MTFYHFANMARTKKQAIQNYNISKSTSRNTRQNKTKAIEHAIPSTSKEQLPLLKRRKRRPKKSGSSSPQQPLQGEEFLLDFFERNTNITDEMKYCQLFPGVIEGDTRTMLNTFLKKPAERLRLPLRFLRFNSQVDQATLLSLHKRPELQSQSGVEQHKSVMEANGFSESVIELFDKNTVFDWIWFDLRSRGDNSEFAVDEIQSFIFKRYDDAQRELTQIELENRGKLITRRQLTYKICWHITNFTEIVKQYLEDNGEDEYNEEKNHIPIFSRWWSAELKNIREKWKFQREWQLVDEDTLAQHVSVCLALPKAQPKALFIRVSLFRIFLNLT